MKFPSLRSAAVAAALLLLPALASAQTLNQVPITNYDATGGSQLLIEANAVTGGTLYTTIVKSPGNPGASIPPAIGVASNFVASSSGGLVRYQSLTNAKLDSGLPTASATGTSTAFGVARTAGTSLSLVGAATSSSAVTTKALWELNTADSYVAGAAIPVTINANYTGTGTVTGASTTLTLAAYTEVNGVETAITGITAAQQFTGTATNYVFSLPATAALTVGQHIVIEVTMLVTSASGANTGQINAVSLTM